MAAMVRLFSQAEEFAEEIYHRKNEAQIHREKEYFAAVKIQAWFRATKVRAYLKYLNLCALTIQKRWRGFLGRKFYRILVKNSVFIMKLNYYNSMATKIQKIWRGYYIRKYVFNYYSRKRYLAALKIKNEIIRSELEEYAEKQETMKKQMRQLQERLNLEHEACKNHHLISTYMIPGIYNSPFQPFPSEQEYLLRSVRPLVVPTKQRTKSKYDPAWVSYNDKLPKHLPPLPQKPQGPFREPEVVQQQRYKPFQPTLRVATDFYSLEKAREIMKADEWVTRLNDDTFLPFTRYRTFYNPLLHTSTEYGNIPYGSKYFREEDLQKLISEKPFKSLVPPIPIFDKLNDTYSQGQV